MDSNKDSTEDLGALRSYASFDEWFYEAEGFASRSERLAAPVSELRAAFECGRGYVCDDDSDSITSDWVFNNFPSMGEQYSARENRKAPGLVWQSRFERFVLYGQPQLHLKTKGDVRRLCKALGFDLRLDT